MIFLIKLMFFLDNRNNDVKYMKKNPMNAKRKKVNLQGRLLWARNLIIIFHFYFKHPFAHLPNNITCA